eukprot:m.38178 g.38178  ORF g.38178 m.38178 type:complete len:877 (+) comp11155_c0_seq3:295-2925(+)
MAHTSQHPPPQGMQPGASASAQGAHSMDMRLDGQDQVFAGLLQAQQQTELRQEAVWRQNRVALSQDFEKLTEKLDEQSGVIRKVWGQQQKLLRLVGIQNKLQDQDRQIQLFIEYQKSFLNSLQTPLELQAEAMQSLQKNQLEMMQAVGLDDKTVEFMSDPDAPLVRNDLGGGQEHQYDAALLEFINEPTSKGGMRAVLNHDPDYDAKLMRKAMKGLGTNERQLLTVVGSRCRAQRLATSLAYATNYKRNLLDDVVSETSGNFGELLRALLMPGAAYDARCVRKAVKGLGTDDTSLVEVVCTRTNQEIRALKHHYKELYKRDVVADVRSDTSGHYQKLLLAVLAGTRDESNHIDIEEVKEDAQQLYSAGEGRMGTNESVFIEILTQKNYAHLRAVFAQYSKLEDFDIEKSIVRETSFNLKAGLLTLVKAARSKPRLFAELLNNAVKGAGSNAARIIRILASRSEIDLYDICDEYMDMYKESLENRLRRELGGNFRKLVLELFDDGDFDPDVDAKRLRGALRGFWRNKTAINRVISVRTLDQRLLVRDRYKAMYKASLVKDLQSELGGDYRTLVISLLTPYDEYLAMEAHRAIAGLGTNDGSLIEIICTRNGYEMKNLKEAYKKKYGSDLSADVRSDTSGHYRSLLCALIDVERDDSEPPNEEAAMEEASRLFRAGEETIGTDESVFIDVLTRHSYPQLKLIFDKYNKLCDYDVAKSITRETSFNFKKALLTVVDVVRDPAEYFARRLRSFIEGVGTEDQNLIRVIVSRSEVDLREIGQAYFKVFKHTLEHDVQDDTSGFYQKLLLRLIRHFGQATNRRVQLTKSQTQAGLGHVSGASAADMPAASAGRSRGRGNAAHHGTRVSGGAAYNVASAPGLL